MPLSRLVCGVVASAAFLASPASLQAQGKEKRTNILIILSDDVGYGEYGFQGNKQIPTPNIDSIAAKGIRFTQGYVSGPYCSPTRAGLMTGRYQTRFGHEFNGQGPNFGLPLSEKTMAELLRSLGYATCVVGKWHLGGEPEFRPTRRGFDEYYGTLANTPFFIPTKFVDSRISPDPVEKKQKSDFYTTEAYATRALDWLEKNRDRPWFLYMPFNAQHAPLEAPQRYLERFAGIQEEKRRTFAAMMSALDDAVGRVLAKVRELGQEEDTLIVFFSDNGGPTPQTTSMNFPLRGFKATTLEGGVRIPFCMQWKGHLPSGKTYEHPIIQLDLLPTCLAAAGAKADPNLKLDGVNLLPYLTGEVSAKPHETLYWRFGEQWAIRKGDWKLVVNKIDGPEPRLFDLAKDIGEAQDLTKEFPDKLKELKLAYDAWNSEQMEPRWGAAMAKMNKMAKKQATAWPDGSRDVRAEARTSALVEGRELAPAPAVRRQDADRR
jgi:arylsulfatase A-like enzyme